MTGVLILRKRERERDARDAPTWRKLGAHTSIERESSVNIQREGRRSFENQRDRSQ